MEQTIPPCIRSGTILQPCAWITFSSAIQQLFTDKYCQNKVPPPEIRFSSTKVLFILCWSEGRFIHYFLSGYSFPFVPSSCLRWKVSSFLYCSCRAFKTEQNTLTPFTPLVSRAGKQNNTPNAFEKHCLVFSKQHKVTTSYKGDSRFPKMPDRWHQRGG